MKRALFSVIVFGVFADVVHAQDRDKRIDDLAKQLTEARQTASALQKTIDSLSDELESLRKTESTPQAATGSCRRRTSSRRPALRA